MKNNRFKLLFVLLLLLSIGLVACGGGEAETAEPEATAVVNNESDVAESAAPVEEEPSVNEEEAPVVEEAPVTNEEEAPVEEPASSIADLLNISEVNAYEGLENYEMDITMTFTSNDENGDEVTQVITADVIYSSDPEAMSMDMSMQGAEEVEALGNMLMVRLEGTNYMVVPTYGCVTTQAGEDTDNPFADLADSDKILEGINEAKFEGEENINGVDTLHYSFDKSNLTEEEALTIELLEGHIYLAKDGGHMVRYVMEGEGLMDQFATGEDQSGSMRMEYNITPIDTAVSIEIPEECAEASAENSLYPVLEDATEYNSFGGFISYKTATSIEDAAAFYEDALAADGWVKNEDAGMYLEGSLASNDYSKDGATISVMISATDGEDSNSVLILVGE